MKQPRSKSGTFAAQIDEDELLVFIHEMEPRRPSDLLGTGRPGWSRASIFRALKRMRQEGSLKRRPSMRLTEEAAVRAEDLLLDRYAAEDRETDFE